ncbi:MAG TPA: heparan-alpha-glucosaminide N-acetyltransferase domain-containing protein [Steroidobacteraceae bacterium]|nr:heparan-alpha-glucosaminide N-acetyltransferase domain-containing protein [Steroidobacteraceae bacterium]
MATIAATQPTLALADDSSVPVGRLRVEAVDVVRGAAMILMALDHTRDFLGVTSVSPTDLVNTTVPLFFTRWITHFCAPVFFLLTGTSAYLSQRGRSKGQLSRYLFTRGLWLIFLELTLFRCFGLQFNFDYHMTVLEVLWALGWAMVVLSLLVHIPRSAIAAFGILLIAGHNMLDSIRSSNPLWSILHVPSFVLKTPQHSVFVVYPLIPWIGVTAVGYSLAVIYDWTLQRRRTFLLWSGVVLMAAFVVIRATNAFGDPVPWTPQRSMQFTALSFLNTTKYPPSLLFLLMTIGPALVLLRAVDGWTAPLLRPVATLGRVPMFYYLLHFPLIHLIAVVVCFARYGQVHWMFESQSISRFPITTPPGWGFSLPMVYLLWVCVVCSLYPLCYWFAAVKQRRGSPWLSYV